MIRTSVLMSSVSVSGSVSVSVSVFVFCVFFPVTAAKTVGEQNCGIFWSLSIQDPRTPGEVDALTSAETQRPFVEKQQVIIIKAIVI